MRELPEQAVHRPFEAGPYRMAMDLVAVPEAEWFEFDQRYSSEMAEKRNLLATAHQDVFAAIPMSAAALCFPSRWRLQNKIGKPLSAVHAPVPHYADRLARPVDRFMRHIKS